MSLSTLNSPPLVAAMGAVVVIGLPTLELATLSTSVLKAANVAALAVNIAATSVPGRLDGPQDQAMRSGSLNPDSKVTPLTKTDDKPVRDSAVQQDTSPSLVRPAGWAFAIWGPIFLGETVFVAAPFLEGTSTAALASILPQVTAPFVAANLIQSLWCASFRPSYQDGWKKFVSPAMLAGTAYSLSHVHAVSCCSAAAADAAWFFVPLTMHFGWTTAATLVDFNRKVATSTNSAVLGHASALAATALGVGVTLLRTSPTYGLTLAWALAAVGDEMGKTRHGGDDNDGAARGRQRLLCLAGSAACLAASLYASVSL